MDPRLKKNAKREKYAYNEDSESDEFLDLKKIRQKVRERRIERNLINKKLNLDQSIFSIILQTL